MVSLRNNFTPPPRYGDPRARFCGGAFLAKTSRIRAKPRRSNVSWWRARHTFFRGKLCASEWNVS